GIVARYGRLYGPGTYYEEMLPPLPRIQIDEAVYATLPLLEASTGIVLIVEPDRRYPLPETRVSAQRLDAGDCCRDRSECPFGLARLAPLAAVASAAATSVAAVGMSSRPPKTTATSANHAQPSARPPTTSDSQCRSRSTRLAATATAMPTAAPMTTCRAERRLSQRPTTSAAAA